MIAEPMTLFADEVAGAIAADVAAPEVIDFWVAGDVKPERKKQRFWRDKSGKTHVGGRTDEPAQVTYKSRVSYRAQETMGNRPPVEGLSA
jgi:hypothetical protein